MTDDDYAATVDSLSSQPDSVRDVADAFARLFPVSGASISTVGDFLGNQTLSASDELAARLDEVQFDLGEGPCWDALSNSRPVLEPDLRSRPGALWPAFSNAVREFDLGAIFAFPIIIGRLRIGAVDFYSAEPTALPEAQTRQAAHLAGLVGRNILRIALSQPDAALDSDADKYSRRRIHQATGMVLAQLEIPAEDAGLIIQGHAFATDRSMMSVADDILAGRLRFTDDAAGIEVSE